MTSASSTPPGASSDVAAAAAKVGLGELRASFGPAKPSSLSWLAVFIVAFTLFAGLLAKAGSWMAVLFAILALSAGVGAVRRWRTNSEFRGARLDLFRDGLAVTTGHGLRVMRYADTSVTQQIVKHAVRGRYNHTTHKYTLRHTSGGQVVLQATSGRVIGGFPRPEEWGPTIQLGVTDAHLPRAWAAIMSGHKVQFGKFWITTDQIGVGNKGWPWSQVDEVRVHDALVQVKSANRWMSLTDSDVSDVENFFVFIALAQRLSGAQSR